MATVDVGTETDTLSGATCRDRGTPESVVNRSLSAASASDRVVWKILGESVPKSEVVFFCQVIIVFTVLCFSLYNLTFKDTSSQLWTSLLSSSLFIMLPNPSISAKNKNAVK